MHRVIHNELRLDVSITPVSPLNIQAEGITPPRFVRAIHPVMDEPTAYLPGSTLKGALRTAAEQILRAAGLDCCDPEHPCAARESVVKAKRAGDNAAVYRSLCHTCRIFGSKAMRSHLFVTDCFPVNPLDARTLREDDLTEVVMDEPFYGTLTLRNFERWQVGLLALLLARINIAEVQLGGSRSAGMGCVAIRYEYLSLIYPGATADQQEALQSRIQGIGQLTGPNNPYGVAYPDTADAVDLPDSATFETGLGYSAVIIRVEQSPSADEDEPEEDRGDQDEVPEIEKIDSAEKVHGVIDNILTQQTLAWTSYLRARKRER